MDYLWLIFGFSLLLGQLGRMELGQGITIYAHDLVLGLLILLRFVKLRERIESTRSINLFILALIVSLLWQILRLPLWIVGVSSLYLVRLIGYLLIISLILESKLGVSFFSFLIYLMGIGFAAVGLAQYGLYPDLRNIEYLGWDPHYYRAVATLLDPNYLGGLLVIIWLWGIWLWEKYAKRRVWLTIGQVVIASAILLTFSRSSFVAWTAGILLIGVLRRRIWIIGVIGMGLIGLFAVLPKPGWGYVQFDRMISTIARIENWQAAWELFRQSPILGWGFNTLRFRNYPNVDLISTAAAGVDSSILFILATGGLVGLIAFVNLMRDWVNLYVKLYKKKQMIEIGTVGLAIIAAILVHSLFVNSLFFPWILIVLILMTGVAIRASDTLTDARG